MHKQKHKSIILAVTIVMLLTAVLIPTTNAIEEPSGQDNTVKINATSKVLYYGETYKLYLTNYSGKILYATSNKDIAVVDKYGKVTPKKSGTAIITLKDKWGKKYTCKIISRDWKLRTYNSGIHFQRLYQKFPSKDAAKMFYTIHANKDGSYYVSDNGATKGQTDTWYKSLTGDFYFRASARNPRVVITMTEPKQILRYIAEDEMNVAYTTMSDSRSSLRYWKKAYDWTVAAGVKSGQSQKTAYTKIATYVRKKVNYDYYGRKHKSGVERQTTWLRGPIDRGLALCGGYADIVQAMCLSAGIDCRIITGKANGGLHAWNRVKLNGVWYYCDVCWQDTSGNISKWGLHRSQLPSHSAQKSETLFEHLHR